MREQNPNQALHMKGKICGSTQRAKEEDSAVLEASKWIATSRNLHQAAVTASSQLDLLESEIGGLGG